MNSKFRAFLYDLGISFLVALITNFLVYILSFKVISFDFLIKYKFYFYWFLLLLFILVVRFIIKKRIDKLQDDPSGSFVMQDYKGSIKMECFGFKWDVFFDYLSEPWMSNDLEKVRFEDLKEVKIGEVRGPYCPNDKRKMKDTRTYWGFYKYKCPKCKYKRTSLKNLTTLENETLDEIRSKFR
ncbi:hypothetical protein [Staphylococcus xylosus]|uniref:hypothetical protein n=1 Tax=Staphylococcus xylosus TaxID=1288 RepID=UPI002DBC5C13|nr:hypothetical protein [Staphylococcus xylosus]MEB6244682.1 hypothetical protein [Staphylococcus xylosus]MEB7766097.1 hypothetical protein [Staphylococcus xylosus]